MVMVITSVQDGGGGWRWMGGIGTAGGVSATGRFAGDWLGSSGMILWYCLSLMLASMFVRSRDEVVEFGLGPADGWLLR